MESVWIWIRTVRCRSFEVTVPHVAHREFMQQGHSKLICIPEPTKQRASMQAACVAAREPCLVMGHRGLGGWRPPRPLSTLYGPFASFLSNLSVKTGCALACSFGLRQILSKCRRPRLQLGARYCTLYLGPNFLATQKIWRNSGLGLNSPR